MNRDDETPRDPELVEPAPTLAAEALPAYQVASIGIPAHLPRGAAFWTQLLRMEVYFEHMPALQESAEYRATLVRRWLNTKRRTQTACTLLGLPTGGRIAERQERLIAHPGVVWLLLACAFLVGMKDKAIDQTCALLLSPEERNQFGENERIDDRNVAAMVLFDRGPEALRTLRVLNEWHSLTAASADLSEPVKSPSTSLQAFLMSDELQDLLARHHERFESLLALDDGQWLLAVNRRHKRRYVLTDDDSLAHGWEEETVVLHFRDGGRSVQISARSGLPSRLLASRIAKAYFGDDALHYRPDLASTRLEAIYAMLEAALDPDTPEIDLTGLKVKEVIDGDAAVSLEHPVSIRRTLDSLSTHYGDLLRRVACIKHLTLKYQNRPFGMYIRKLRDRWVVQFADGRSDNFKAAAFRRYLWETFGVEVRSKATGGRWL